MGKKLLVFIFLLVNSCGLNIYSGLSNTVSDSALYAEALKKLNSGDYDGAIGYFQTMSTAAQGNRDVAYDFASAAAGKCGYDFITFANYMAAVPADFGSTIPPSATTTPVLYYLMNGFVGTTINTTVSGQTDPTAAGDATTRDYCAWAQQLMDNIKTNYGSWNTKESSFVFYFAMARLGIILRAWGDINVADGDGTADASFNACDSTDLPDFYANQLVTGFALMNETSASVAGLGAVIGALLTPFCAAYGNLCTHTTPSTVTAADRKNVRGLSLLAYVNGFSMYNAMVAPSQGSDPATGNQWQCDGTNAAGTDLNCCP
jgi:hypothetical protein